MLIDDRFFQQHPSEAYAVAWAVSLYLAERDTKSYISLLRHYSKMDIGQETSAGQRISDFKSFFSGDPYMLIKTTDRFLSGL